MQWYELTVTLLTGLAWPVAIGVIVWGFRAKIKEMLDRTRSLTLPGGVEWQAQQIAEKEDELQAEVAESAPVLVLPESGPVEQGPSDSPPSDGNGKPPARPGVPGHAMLGGSGRLAAGTTARSGLVASQREAFEDVVRRASEWGAARGRAGLGVEGTKVEWSKNGAPRLVIPSVHTDRLAYARAWNRRVRDAEKLVHLRAEMAQLEAALEDAQRSGDSVRVEHAGREVDAARTRLRDLYLIDFPPPTARP